MSTPILSDSLGSGKPHCLVKVVIASHDQAMYVDKKAVKQLTGLSGETLKRYRRDGRWQEGIHWVRINERVIRYNWPLLKDWFQNSQDPVAHQRAIETFQAGLLSNQPRKRGSK
jgi:hypothetical protein